MLCGVFIAGDRQVFVSVVLQWQ